ncbi:MAG TPA: PLP-dependent aminotransferase family protein [Puia sp.]|nr:PLP-dependent aminotransferase family protein [Puia sp.]
MQEPIYVGLAKKMSAMIEKGVYKAGDKLPSLRSIHKQSGISIGTILQAFIYLQDKGLVSSRKKSGYFVNYQSKQHLPLPQTIPVSLSERTVHTDKLLQKLRKEGSGKNFVSFANALPDHRLLPFNSIKRAIQNGSRNISGSYLSLEEPKGSSQLREAIAKRSFTWKGLLHADDVIITNGAIEAVNLCLKAVTQPGDTVLVQAPCYYGIMQSLEFLNLKVVAIPCHSQTGINIEDIEDACSKLKIKACVLVSNFNNPNGVCLSSEKKKEIARFANKMKLPVIEDDIYGDIFFEHNRPDTIKTYDTHGWVLLCNSFSKSLFPGFRLGWCAPGRFIYEVERFKSMTNLASCNFTQQVLYELLNTGLYDRHLQKFRNELHKNLVRTIHQIEQYFPQGTKITRPLGGLVIWVELPEHINSVQLQEAALDQKISFAPGEIFSAKGDYKNFIRISYCNMWDKKNERALMKLGVLCQSWPNSVSTVGGE